MFKFSTLVFHVIAVTLVACTPANQKAAQLQQDDIPHPLLDKPTKMDELLKKVGFHAMPPGVLQTVEFTTADGRIFPYLEVVDIIMTDDDEASKLINKLVDPKTKITYDEEMYRTFLGEDAI